MKDFNSELDLGSAMLKRQDLKNATSETELQIVKYLIEYDLEEYFSVNWRKLERLIN